MNILIIVAEVILTLLVFYLVDWLFGKVFKLLKRLPMLQSWDRSANSVRRNMRGILLFCCAILCILIVGCNSFLLYRGENLQQYTLLLIRRIPVGFWINLGIAGLQSLGILMVAALLQRPVQHGLGLACIRAKNWQQITSDDESIEAFFRSLERILTSGIWLLALIWCTQFFKVPEVVSQYFFILLRIYLIIAVGLLILKAVAVIIDSLDILSIQYSSPDNFLRFYERLRNLIPFFKSSVEYVLYVCMATLIVQQVELIANLAFWGTKIVKLIGIIFISRVLVELAHLSFEELLLKNRNMTELQMQRRQTLIPLFQSSSQYIIYLGAAIFILDTIDINPAPILAGVGIVGLALGFGAQNLVNDMVSGFFILFENYYLVGDYIEAGKAEEKVVEGIVEAIELRTTRLRHPNGQLQIIRNGDIGSIINYSKHYIYAVVELRVYYESNMQHVCRVIEEVGQQLKTEYPEIIEPTKVDGIEEFGEYYLLLRTSTKVKPGKNLQIQRFLRQKILDAFNREGIQFPMNRKD